MKRGEVRREFLPRVSSHIYTGSFKKPVVKPINSEKLDGLVNVQSLDEILPESVCLNLRAELSSKLHESAKNCLDVKNEKPPNFVVEVPGFGMVDREGLQEMIKLHKLHQTVREVQEERAWFKNTESHLSSSKGLMELLKPVKAYVDVLWSSEENDKVFGMHIKDAMRLVCNRWFSDDLIGCFFSMFNTLSEEHGFLVFDPLMTNPAHLLQRVRDVIKVTTKYLHFALNVKNTGNSDVAIGNGNHWVYVLVTTDGENIIYGDPKGWEIPKTLRSCFQPLITMLKERDGHKQNRTVKLNIMHHPRFGHVHRCVKGCNDHFPVQTCQEFCGGIVVLVCSASILLPDFWHDMIFGEKFPILTTENKTLRMLMRHPSSHALMWRSLMIAWLTDKNMMSVVFGPVLQFSPPMPIIHPHNYDLEFPPIGTADHAQRRSKG